MCLNCLVRAEAANGTAEPSITTVSDPCAALKEISRVGKMPHRDYLDAWGRATARQQTPVRERILRARTIHQSICRTLTSHIGPLVARESYARCDIAVPLMYACIHILQARDCL